MSKKMTNFAATNIRKTKNYCLMKHTFTFFAIVASAVLMLSCGNNAGTASSSNPQSEWYQQWGENPDTFRTPDLNFLSLRGHVKKMVMNGRTEFELDRDGNLTYLKLHGLSLDDITRNQQGQIIKLTNLEYAKSEDVVIFEYGYDSNGFLEYEARFMPNGSHYHHYILDRLGNVEKGEFEYSKGKESIQAMELYKYDGIDEHGNWTKLTVTKNSTIEPEFTVEREIEYYE